MKRVDEGEKGQNNEGYLDLSSYKEATNKQDNECTTLVNIAYDNTIWKNPNILMDKGKREGTKR
jgi:hypothetical protein